MTLYYLPIQPLEERYSKFWYRWFPEEFKKRGIDYKVIDGEILTEGIKTGAFLDTNGAHYYTFSQLREISKLFHQKKIKSGDKFFVADIEFPGHAEAIKNMVTWEDCNDWYFPREFYHNFNTAEELGIRE